MKGAPWNGFRGIRGCGPPRSHDALVIAGFTALALAILAAAGVAATNRSLGRTVEHAAARGLRDTGGGKDADDHERDVERHDAAHVHAPVAPLRQDRRSCANISGATASAYKLQGADGGHTLRAVVTAKNNDGTESATSVPTRWSPTSR